MSLSVSLVSGVVPQLPTSSCSNNYCFSKSNFALLYNASTHNYNNIIVQRTINEAGVLLVQSIP